MLKNFNLYSKSLGVLDSSKQLITTLNAHSYNVACFDNSFSEVLHYSDVLIPDGESIVWAVKWLTGQRLKKIAGEDLFYYEMQRLEDLPPNPLKGVLRKRAAMFLGSTEEVLAKIKSRAAMEYPNVEVHTFSPPYKVEFSDIENKNMIQAVNKVQPDVLFIGMTAPKQEKWAYQHLNELQAGHICCIGAVFDFYAGTVKRAPKWMIKLGLEWVYRLIKEPKRMWRRYLIGNLKFIFYIVQEKFGLYKKN